MRTLAFHILVCIGLSVDWATGAQGPAGPSGACSHVLGPIGSTGLPIGFTCENVGGSALLIWNASQSSDTINITGGIKTVSFFPTDFTLDGSITSSGPLALIGGGAGGGIFINGSVIAPSLLIAAVDASLADVKAGLMGPTGTLTSTTSAPVYFGVTSIVKATSGNLIVVGSNIINDGDLNAPNGTAIMKTGSKLSFSFDQATWLEGVTGVDDHSIVNNGKITAGSIYLEAQRTATTDFSVINTGKLSATHTITFVTGTPGHAGSTGVHSPLSFGIENSGGQIVAAQVTISPYFQAAPGGNATDRTFNTGGSSAERAALQTDISGDVFEPTQDNTPGGASAPVIDSGKTFTVTGNIVVPQLAPSLTNLNASQMNATSKGTTLALASGSSEQVRGDGTQLTVKKPKSRTKAKPVLVRGAFFQSKISAVISPNP